VPILKPQNKALGFKNKKKNSKNKKIKNISSCLLHLSLLYIPIIMLITGRREEEELEE
jgi:hypothetical protein